MADLAYLFLDYETRATEDIDEIGLDNYSRIAQPLMLGWARNKNKIRVWFPKESMPAELHESLLDPSVIKIAWYAGFERLITERGAGIHIPISQWRDPMILARSLSMPGKLERVCEIMKLSSDEAKIEDGKRLINLFCKPNPKRAGQVTLFGMDDGFSDEQTHPKDWQLFVDYCVRDVTVERDLWYKFLPLSFPEEQWEDWFISEEINDTGLPVNLDRCAKALRLAVRYKEEAARSLNQMTGLENANSRDQLLGWLHTQNYKLGSIQKSDVKSELETNPELTELAKQVIRLRQRSSQTSYKKLERILKQVSPDGYLRHQFMYMGAARTGRWSSGGGINVQNLPRPIKVVEENLEKALDLVDREDYDGIVREYNGLVLPVVSSCLRSVFEV